MSEELYRLPTGEEVGLGCNVPDEFPTGFTAFADAMAPRMLTMDQIRRELAGKPSMYGRRGVFGPSWISSQRSTNACNGHSVARALSRMIYLKSGQMVLLSGADAYSQMNGGRDRGSTLANGVRVIESGIATEASVPWNLIYSHQIPESAKAERQRFKGLEPYAVDTEEELATGLLLGFVAVVAVHVASGFDSADGDGVCRGGNGPGNHSVGLDDVRINPTSGELDFDMFNSWGAAWGQDGRTRLQWGRHLRESVKYHRFFLLRSSLDDPKQDGPPEVRE